MTKIKKKDFISKINELVDAEGAPIQGDRNVTNNSEIETGPVQPSFDDNSDYEKGVATTTDRAARYKQPINWLTGLGYGGSAYSHGIRTSLSITEDSSAKIKKMIKEFLKQKSNDNDVVKKYNDTDINRNKIADLDELNSLAAVSKTKEFLNVIKNNNLKGDQIGMILNYVINNVDTSKISKDYKNIIIKKINNA